MMEQVVAGASAARARVALFDFDGTISLVRSGWMDVMIPMMVDLLQATGTGESPEELEGVVREFVARLTGKQTIYQMIELASQITQRGGQPEDPLVYKRMYLDRLHHRISHRLEGLQKGATAPDQYLVPGSRDLLEALRDRGLTLILASGTDEEFVRNEARLLDVERYFDGGIFGAQDDYRSFSKKLVVHRILTSGTCTGPELVGFGDGYVEIDEVKLAGGTAVGVATDEPDCLVVDEWKRQRLIGVGADFIVPNYTERTQWWPTLFPSQVMNAVEVSAV